MFTRKPIIKTNLELPILVCNILIDWKVNIIIIDQKHIIITM